MAEAIVSHVFVESQPPCMSPCNPVLLQVVVNHIANQSLYLSPINLTGLTASRLQMAYARETSHRR